MNSFIFIGRSGCGKGTQVSLFQEFLKKHDTSPVLYIETGEEFRNFISRDGYSNKLSNDIYKTGERQPSFLACYMWSKLLLENFSGKEQVIFDGTPRALAEAQVLESALNFYGFEKIFVVHLDVSREWSKERLIARGRVDDKNRDEIDKRLDWFEKDVVPAIEYFKSTPFFTYIKINGEETIEKVGENIAQVMSERLNYGN